MEVSSDQKGCKRKGPIYIMGWCEPFINSQIANSYIQNSLAHIICHVWHSASQNGTLAQQHIWWLTKWLKEKS